MGMVSATITGANAQVMGGICRKTIGTSAYASMTPTMTSATSPPESMDDLQIKNLWREMPNHTSAE